jgi:hypothetical protein
VRLVFSRREAGLKAQPTMFCCPRQQNKEPGDFLKIKKRVMQVMLWWLQPPKHDLQ